MQSLVYKYSWFYSSPIYGAAPIQRSIMNLDSETGISVMKINEKLDTGPVCGVYKIGISPKC